MNDLDRIKYIEEKLGFKLNKVSLENLFTEKSFLATSSFWAYSLFDRLDPKFYYKGVRNYSLDENGNVTGLALDFCGLFVLEDNYLGNFEHLKKLKIKSSRLTDYKFLFKLKNLTSLDLSSNQLSNADFLKELSGLTSLDLSYNQLSNADFLKELSGLTSLDLRNNNLSNADFLKELSGLTSLDLSYNNLSNADFLKDLTALTSLYLYGNSNLDLPQNLKKMIEDKGEFSSLNRDEINLIIRYLEQLEEQGKEYIYEARALIVGESGAGKTTLFRKLKDNQYVPKELTDAEKQSTVGVKIYREWEFDFVKDKTKKFTGHLWDFGGQKIQYALHQYFLTEKSLYIVLADDRKQLNNFHYWFEIIATLGEDCPVLVVLNEINHESITNFSLNTYQTEFAKKIKVIDKLEVDFLIEDGRFQNLQRYIQTALSNLKHIGTPVPALWKVVREELETLSQDKAHISLKEYYKVCRDKKISRKDDAQSLLDNLHYLGIALNYKGDENLEEIVILSPNWIIDALYSVLKNKTIKENFAKFDKAYVFTIWQKQGYEQEDCKLLLSLMLKGKFEIAYKLKEANKYIVPLLLPETEPEYIFDTKNIIQIYLKYTFMPAGILSRFIVRMNEFITEQNNKQIVWEKGVLLNHKSSVAEIIENQYQGQIVVKVSGENFIHNKEAITIIRNEFDKINNDWFEKRLIVDEFVPCICEVCKDIEDKQFYSLQELEDYLSSNDFEIKCAKSRKERNPQIKNVRELLEGVYIENRFKGKQKDMENRNTFNIAGNAQIITDPKDSVSISQNNYENDSTEINKQLDAMFEKLDKTHAIELEMLTDKLFILLDERIAKTNDLSKEKVEEFNKAKWSGDTKFKLKIGLPLSGITGISAEFEQEWKRSKEITPDSIISFLRKVLRHEELQETGFNQLNETN